MKNPVIKEIYHKLPLFIAALASMFSIIIFLMEFHYVEYIKIIAGIFGASTGLLVAYSLAKLRTLLGAPKVFISYSNNDLAFVLKLCNELKRLPISILLDIDELQVGDSINKKLAEMVDECDYFLIVVSKKSVDSEWMNKEIDNAIKKNKRLLPVVIDDISPLPKIISDFVYADFRNSFDFGFDQLSKALKTTKRNSKINNDVVNS